jgi:hypothetical protein
VVVCYTFIIFEN